VVDFKQHHRRDRHLLGRHHNIITKVNIKALNNGRSSKSAAAPPRRIYEANGEHANERQFEVRR
jgi:hypothetical protein